MEINKSVKVSAFIVFVIGVLGLVMAGGFILFSQVEIYWGASILFITIVAAAMIAFSVLLMVSAHNLLHQKLWAYFVSIIQLTLIEFWILYQILYSVFVGMVGSSYSIAQRLFFLLSSDLLNVLVFLAIFFVVSSLYKNRSQFPIYEFKFKMVWVFVIAFLLVFCSSYAFINGSKKREENLKIIKEGQAVEDSRKYSKYYTEGEVITEKGTVVYNDYERNTVAYIYFFDKDRTNSKGDGISVSYNFKKGEYKYTEDRDASGKLRMVSGEATYIKCENYMPDVYNFKTGDIIEVKGIVEKGGIGLDTCDSKDYYIKLVK